MASLIDELINVLEEEYELYQRLIPVVDEKTQVIVKNDLVSLQRITDEEQLAIDRVGVLEHKRENIMNNIRTVLSKRTGDMNLSTLIKLMENQPEQQKALSVIHDKLKDTVQRLVRANDRNQTLIMHSLEMIEFNMNFIQSTRMFPGDNTYTKNASEYMAQMQGTGMFDAKQ